MGMALMLNGAEVNETASVSSKLASCTITEYVLALQDDCKFGYDTIHGLWPDPASSCTTCTSEVFSESKLSSTTLSNMKKYWPTCQSGTNDDFWSHEWSKHGTCSGLSQDAYFSKALSLYSTYGSKCTTDCYLCFTPSFSYEGKNVC
eukprot:CAMPEP_0170073124 /NCGR_PEP_ID=MMETSP0019_2-20121128/10594_1 /TAXON_ID=98059 /ORGANISM="Dinobryon sp., Strain UTEXLB2267" /LENGTH=146 /DNA_ID=CAMNT_0010282445 /DNA_START=192 /DNA_END=632 /DNA_ORIENTATION=-